MITHYLVFTPPVAFGTGTLVWQSFPKLEALGSTTMWSDPLAPDQASAVKYFSMTRFIGNLLVTQGERMLTTLDDIIVDLEQAISR